MIPSAHPQKMISSLTQIRGTASESIDSWLKLAARMEACPSEFSSSLKSKSILHYFAENSTRTRMSFETAVRRLGGTNLSFAVSHSSSAKGESLLDTLRTVQRYGVDALVMRHGSVGATEWVSSATQLPVISAGEGSHEHPTQALTDAYTLIKHWRLQDRPLAEKFLGKTILILGDTLHSRVARSNIHLLTRLGARVIVAGPRTVQIADQSLFPKIETHDFPDAILPGCDAVITLRIQFERQSQGLIPSKTEYRHFWGLTTERAGQMKESAVILHPGPMNRGIEIDSEVADSARSLVLDQVQNGVWVRMAVLANLIGGVA